MVAGRRRAPGRGRVLAGSVWESRMKVDAVNGGIKVFSDKDSGDLTNDGKLVARASRTAGAGVGVGPERRKRWQPDAERVPLQIRKSGSGAACAGARLRPSMSLGDIGGGKDEEGEEEGDDEEGEKEDIEMVDVEEVDANSKIPQIVAQPEEQQQEGAISVASIAKEMDYGVLFFFSGLWRLRYMLFLGSSVSSFLVRIEVKSLELCQFFCGMVIWFLCFGCGGFEGGKTSGICGVCCCFCVLVAEFLCSGAKKMDERPQYCWFWSFLG